MLDNVSVNSGLVSNNYSGFNTSTIEQISVLTGGYNAEYGEGRSAVVNIVSKEASEGIHCALIGRVRPPGVYHFGRNMYSKENNDYVSTGIEYWTRQSQDLNSRYYRLNPDSLLQAWRKQITPPEVMGNYANLPEYEIEGTLYGGVTEDLGFLASGRFKEGVGMFPQPIPYNPEFNIQPRSSRSAVPAPVIVASGVRRSCDTALSSELRICSLRARCVAARASTPSRRCSTANATWRAKTSRKPRWVASRTSADGYDGKTLLLDLLAIPDPDGVGGDGDFFRLPFYTIESVHLLDARTLLIASDNNFPFSNGRSRSRSADRAGSLAADATEIVLVRLGAPLAVDRRLLPAAARVEPLSR